MGWKKLLEAASESLNEHMRLRNDYLAAENRILRNQIDGRVQLTDSERKELAALGAQLGKKALSEIATIAKPETIRAWNRKFTDQPVDNSERPKFVGRPRVDQEVEDWVLRMARENRSWGYDRIQGSLKHLGYTISDQTVGNVLKRHGISPAPERKKTVTWREFIRSHWDVFVATGFFGSEVWSWLGLVMSCLLSFIHFSHRQVQSMLMTWYQQIPTMQALLQQSLDLCLHLRQWVYLVTERSQTRGKDKTVLGIIETKASLAALRHMPSREMGKMVILSAAQPQQIRYGPVRYRPKKYDLLRSIDCLAA